MPNRPVSAKTHALQTSCAIGLALIALSRSPEAHAQFAGTPAVAAGAVDTSNPTNIIVNTPSAVVNWGPTDNATNNGVPIDFLQSGNTVTFTGTSDYTVLNRIIANDLTRAIGINGTVNSNISGGPGGNVWFYSPSGLIVGDTAVFSVGGLLLTANDVPYDTGPAGRIRNTSNGEYLTGGRVRFTAANNSTATIDIRSGAQINAINDGTSYAAFIAPQIFQNGTVNVNGSIAYVAAEVADIRINSGMFDIQVTAGTSVVNAISHRGSSLSPALSGPTDKQFIYLTAVPKSTAINLLVMGTLGADAASASMADSAVILSAGDFVYAGIAPSSVNVSIDIRDAEFKTNLIANSTGTTRASANAGNQLRFRGDATLSGNFTILNADGSIGAARNLTVIGTGYNNTGGTAFVQSNIGGSITVQNNLTLDASQRIINSAAPQTPSDPPINIIGGSAVMIANGGSIQVNGTTALDASAFNPTSFFGSPLRIASTTGGSISILSDGPSSVLNLGNVVMNANGDGGVASKSMGRGGNIVFDIRGGTIGSSSRPISFTATANGTGGNDELGYGTTTDNAGYGGNIIYAQIAGTTYISTLALSADGQGGQYLESTKAGNGYGGIITMRHRGTDPVSDIIVADNIMLSAKGIGGGPPISPNIADSGDGFGGTINFTSSKRMFSDVFLADMSGIGGNGRNVFNANGGNAGNGTGGSANITFTDEEFISSKSFTVLANGTGGTGGSSGTQIGGAGGNGSGGNILFSAAGLNTKFTAETFQASSDPPNMGVILQAIGTGGNAGLSNSDTGSNNNGDIASRAGANGGNGIGGNAEFRLSNGASARIDAPVNISATGIGGAGNSGTEGISGNVDFSTPGGDGGNGGNGGSALGGSAKLTIMDANLRGLFNDAVLSADAIGGLGGNGGVSGNDAGYGTGMGGAFGHGGNAAGGTAEMIISNGDFAFFNTSMSANGSAGAVGNSAASPNPPAMGTPTASEIGSGGIVRITHSGNANLASGQARNLNNTTLNAIGSSPNNTTNIGRVEINNSATATGGGLNFADLTVNALGQNSTANSGVFINSSATSINAGTITSNSSDITNINADGTGNITPYSLIINSRGDVTVSHGNAGNTETISAHDINIRTESDFFAGTGSIINASMLPFGAHDNDITISAVGTIDVASLKAIDDIRLFSGGNTVIGDVLANGDAGPDSSSGGLFGGRLVVNAGYRNLVDPSGPPSTTASASSDVIFNGNVSVTGEVFVQASRDIIVQTGSSLNSDNRITFQTGDDIIVQTGAAVTAGLSPTADTGYGGTAPPVLLAKLDLNAGSLNPFGSPAAGDIATILVDGTLAVPDRALLLSANAIQADANAINVGSIYASVYNPPAIGSPTSNDGGALRADCVQGNICLGAISANRTIQIGGFSDNTGMRGTIPNTLSILGGGTANAMDVNIRARDNITIGTLGTATILGGSNSFDLASLTGTLSLLGNVVLSGGSIFNIFASQDIVGDGTSLFGTGDIGLSTGGNFTIGSIQAGGVINTIDNSGAVTTAGTFTVPQAIMINGVLSVNGDASLQANSGISVGIVQVPNTSSVSFITNSGLVNLGITGNNFMVPSNITLSGDSIIAGNLSSVGNMDFSARSGSIAVGALNAGGFIRLTSAGDLNITSSAISGSYIDVQSAGIATITSGQARTSFTVNASGIDAGTIATTGLNLTSGENADITLRTLGTSGITVGSANAAAGMTLDSAASITTTGNLTANADITLLSPNMIQLGGGVSTGGNVIFNTAGNVVAQDITSTAGILVLSSNFSVNNLTSASSIDVESDNFTANNLMAGSYIDIESGVFNANDLNAGSYVAIEAGTDLGLGINTTTQGFTAHNITAGESIGIAVNGHATLNAAVASEYIGLGSSGNITVTDALRTTNMLNSTTNPNPLYMNGETAIAAGGSVNIGSIDSAGHIFVMNTPSRSSDGFTSIFATTSVPADITIGTIIGHGTAGTATGIAVDNMGQLSTTPGSGPASGNGLDIDSSGSINVGDTNIDQSINLAAAGTITTANFVSGNNIAATAGNGMNIGAATAGHDINLNSLGTTNLTAVSLTAANSITAQSNLMTQIGSATTTGANGGIGTISVTGGSGLSVGNIDATGNVLLDGTIGDIILNSRLSLDGNLSVFGGNISITSSDPLDVERILARTGNLSITSTNMLTIRAASAAGNITLTSQSSDLIVNRLSAGVDLSGPGRAGPGFPPSASRGFGDITLTSGRDVIVNPVVSDIPNVSITATRNIGITAVRNAVINSGIFAPTAISVSSGDIMISGAGQIGSTAMRPNITISNNDTTRRSYVGGKDTSLGYSLSDTELTKIFGNNITITLADVAAQSSTSVGSSSPPDVIVDSFTLSADANGNLGNSGTLRIDTPGKMRVIGAVRLTNLNNANRLELVANDALEIIAGSGSIDLRGAGTGLAGTLFLSSDDIIAATASAITDVAAATTTNAINDRLAKNDGIISDDGHVRAGAIQANFRNGFYIQNSGADAPAASAGLPAAATTPVNDLRRGFTVGQGGLTLTTSSQSSQPVISRIVINGRQVSTNAAGVSTTSVGQSVIPLVMINGKTGAAVTGIDPRSTINGCVITGASCNAAAAAELPPEFVVSDDTLEGIFDEEAPQETHDSLFPSVLIQFIEFTELGYEPLIDDPVTGAGNDDLWAQPDCDPANQQCR